MAGLCPRQRPDRKSGLAIGENYIRVCEQASASPNDEPALIVQGIRQVISGDLQEFFINYPCHSPQKQSWYALRVVRFREPRTSKVILAHENITPLVLVQRSLAQKEGELRDQAEKLEEGNIALKVLLKHREEDRRQLEEGVLGGAVFMGEHNKIA